MGGEQVTLQLHTKLNSFPEWHKWWLQKIAQLSGSHYFKLVTSLLKIDNYWTAQSLKYSIKISGDHVKLKSLCCSYNIQFKPMYTQHEQNTDVCSLDTISQQKFINVHRIWTENRSSFSALLLHQSSSHFLRLRGLSSHCAGSSSFITNPTEHSTSREANKCSASPEIPCIYVIWRFTIKFQRPVHSTRSERVSVHILLWKSYRSYKAECYWDLSQSVYSVIQHAPSQHLQAPVADAADPAPVLLVLSPALHNEQAGAPTSYSTSSCSILPYSVATGNFHTTAGHLLP